MISVPTWLFVLLIVMSSILALEVLLIAISMISFLIAERKRGVDEE